MTSPFLATSIPNLFDFFKQGGFFMVLLLVCSVISIMVMILRGIALRRSAVMPKAIEQEIEAMQPGDNTDAVVKLSRLVRGDESPLARIAQVGLQHLQWPKSENVEAVQTKARHEIVRLESGLFILEIIVGIAPLLGLLGAVSGLVSVFADFAKSTAENEHEIAKGISEALSTTIVGIAVAIPSLIAYSYFSKKVEVMASEMETLIADLVAKCYFQKKRREARAEVYEGL
ncbi:MAG TPA: MotA/TolQ/ExbB proton channel family protein [Chthoniobacteraceae bacterium]|nr:MotA/TolQ/ExbB proton channel family protein [Chthoniobacteraceae bacterium]